MNKITKSITKIAERNAIKNADFLCRIFVHQPKVPVKLLAMKNIK